MFELESERLVSCLDRREIYLSIYIYICAHTKRVSIYGLFIYEAFDGWEGGKETHTSKPRLYQGTPSPHTDIADLSSWRGKGRKRNHVFCYYYFCLFFIEEIIGTRASPRARPLGDGGEHTSLWFFIFLRSHHLNNQEFLCAGGRLPSGGCLGEAAAWPSSWDQKQAPNSTPAWRPAPQPWPGGPGLTLRCPRGGGARANSPPLCQPGYGPQCVPCSCTQPKSNKK